MRNAVQHIFTHKAWKPLLLHTPSFIRTEYQHDKSNGAKFKIMCRICTPVTEVYNFTQLHHFRLDVPTILQFPFSFINKVVTPKITFTVLKRENFLFGLDSEAVPFRVRFLKNVGITSQ
jgi:hypothetical protein